jgi:UDP-glucuronate 4-epimerase
MLNLGYTVVGLDNFDDYYDPAIKSDNIAALREKNSFVLIDGDIRDRALLSRVFSENHIGTVMHLAARAGVRPSLEQPLLYEDVNAGGTLNLLESCRTARVRQFLFASSSSVYGVNGRVPFKEDETGYPISPYAASKSSAELYCRTYSYLYGLPVVVLRLFTVYGPRQRPEMAIHHFVRLVNQGEEVFLFGDGMAKRDYTYIDDIVAGFEAALTRCNTMFQVFNLGRGSAVDLKYLLRLIEEALGKKAKVRSLAQRPGEVPVTLADISKARAVLGYEPKVSIEDGVSLFVGWYLENRRQ